jgi:hypothetical protein
VFVYKEEEEEEEEERRKKKKKKKEEKKKEEEDGKLCCSWASSLTALSHYTVFVSFGLTLLPQQFLTQLQEAFLLHSPAEKTVPYSEQEQESSRSSRSIGSSVRGFSASIDYKHGPRSARSRSRCSCLGRCHCF